MDIFGVLALLGGLAIFLYGMDLLGEGLTGASGVHRQVYQQDLRDTERRHDYAASGQDLHRGNDGKVPPEARKPHGSHHPRFD